MRKIALVLVALVIAVSIGSGVSSGAEAQQATTAAITFLSASTKLELPAVGEEVEVAAAVAPQVTTIQVRIDSPTPRAEAFTVGCLNPPVPAPAAEVDPTTATTTTTTTTTPEPGQITCSPVDGIVTVLVTATADEASGTLVLIGNDGSVARRNLAVERAAPIGPTSDGTVALPLFKADGSRCVTDLPVAGAGSATATITAMGPGGAGKIVIDPAKTCTAGGRSGILWMLSGFDAVGTYTGSLTSGTGDAATKLTVEVKRSSPVWLCILLLLIGSLIASVLATITAFRRICSQQDLLVDALLVELESFGRKVPASLPRLKPEPAGLISAVEGLRPRLRLIIPGPKRKEELASLLGPKGEQYTAVVARVAAYGRLVAVAPHLDTAATQLGTLLASPTRLAADATWTDARRSTAEATLNEAREDLGFVDETSTAPTQATPIDVYASLGRAEEVLGALCAFPGTPDAPDVEALGAEADELLVRYAQPKRPPRGVYARSVTRPRAEGNLAQGRDAVSWLAITGLAFVVTTAVAVGLGLVQTYYKGDTWGTHGEILAALFLASTLSAAFNVSRYVALNAGLTTTATAPSEDKDDGA